MIRDSVVRMLKMISIEYKKSIINTHSFFKHTYSPKESSNKGNSRTNCCWVDIEIFSVFLADFRGVVR